MYFSVLSFPALGCLTSLLFGRFLGGRGAGICTISCLGISMVFSWVAFYEVALCGSPVFFKFNNWIGSEILNIQWGFQFDTLTVVMICVVTSVSFLVHLYSLSYMAYDPHLVRFLSYLSLFTFFMLILVTSDNLLGLFLGWEGIGLASYLLIGFWFSRIPANQASIKAMLVNRVGDIGLCLGLLILYSLVSALDYPTLFSSLPYIDFKESLKIFGFSIPLLDLACLFLFLGVLGKSAQLILQTWLPDAMEGPTPVSALIHAATLVTAGVFLCARCSPLYEHSPICLGVISCIGVCTALYAGLTGSTQNDLKRIIAYSTCGQIGYMVLACGLSCYGLAIFHMANHAFFKALLFLCAGALIHAFTDQQDIRKLGGVNKLLPVSYSVLLIGSLSLCGTPFLTGYYSKDLIIEAACTKLFLSNEFIIWLAWLSLEFTPYYSFRSFISGFLGEPNSSKKDISNLHDASSLMSLVFFPLILGSLFLGYTFQDMMVGPGTDFWGTSIQPQGALEAEYTSVYYKLIPLVLSLMGWLVCISLQTLYPFVSAKLLSIWPVYQFSNRRGFLDFVQNKLIAYPLTWIGLKGSFEAMDKGFLEIIGPFGIIHFTRELVIPLRAYQSGSVSLSAWIFIASLTTLIAILSFWSLFLIDISYSGIICLFIIIFLTQESKKSI